jgi:homocitrate synthase NifV
MPRTVKLIDTTLRDGAQAPGVTFDRHTRLAVAHALAELGVDELEAGTPAMGVREESDLRLLVDQRFNCRISAWCRARTDDLAAAGRSGVSDVHISLPVSDIHLAALNKDRSWVLDRLHALLPVAASQFERVTIGAQDATRADITWLTTFAHTAASLGAHRLRIADTVGIGRPATVAGLIGHLGATIPELPLEFHGHNDLGMATANALAAAEAGADAISVTVNGLGERAGNTALEQLVMAVNPHPDLACNTDSHGLLPLCQMVATASGRPIAGDRPIVGEMAFSHESGIHCHAMIRDPHTYEPFDPRQIGRANRRFVMGSHSGSAGIRHLLEQAGICASPLQVETLCTLLKGV